MRFGTIRLPAFGMYVRVRGGMRVGILLEYRHCAESCTTAYIKRRKCEKQQERVHHIYKYIFYCYLCIEMADSPLGLQTIASSARTPIGHSGHHRGLRTQRFQQRIYDVWRGGREGKWLVMMVAHGAVHEETCRTRFQATLLFLLHLHTARVIGCVRTGGQCPRIPRPFREFFNAVHHNTFIQLNFPQTHFLLEQFLLHFSLIQESP